MKQYKYHRRQHQYTGSLEDEIGAYGGEEVIPRNYHRDVEQLTNTRTNAALPNRNPRAAAQRQAETEARQRNLRGNSRIPPDGLPRGRARNHDEDDATAQPPPSALPFRPTDGAGASTIPVVQPRHHTHN